MYDNNPQQQNYSTAAPHPEDPGHIFALIGIIASVCGFAAIGAILSAIGYSKSKTVGIKNTLAIWGIIIGVTFSIIGTVILILLAPLIIGSIGDLYEKCKELGPGTHKVDGSTYTCGEHKSNSEFEFSLGS